MNLSHRLRGVCLSGLGISLITQLLGCGGRPGLPPTVAAPTTVSVGPPGPAILPERPVPQEFGQGSVASLAFSPPGATQGTVRPATDRPSGALTTLTRITVDTQAETAVVSLYTTGTTPRVQIKQQVNPPRLVLDITPARLGLAHAPALTASDPAGVVTHLEALAGSDGPDPAVKVVVYVRTAATFEVRQDSDILRLVMAKAPAASPDMATPVPAAPSRQLFLAERPATALTSAPSMPRVAQVNPLGRRSASSVAAGPPPAPTTPAPAGGGYSGYAWWAQ